MASEEDGECEGCEGSERLGRRQGPGTRDGRGASSGIAPSHGRVLYYDVLNVVAILGVVFMHFNGLAHAYQPTPEWAQALVAECLFYWAVPVFYMLSGATLLHYRERYGTREFLAKRARRTLVPFLAWSVMALVWRIATLQIDPYMGPRTFINMIMNTQVLDVYWFFIPLFANYLAFPVLSVLADGKHDRVLWYAVGITFLTVSVLPCLLGLVGVRFNPGLQPPLLTGYLMFPVLGYLLARTPLSRRVRAGIYVAGVAGLLLRYLSTLLLSSPADGMYQAFWGVTNFPGVLLSVAVFVAARQIRWERVFSTPRRVKVLRKVAGGSFGVYLTHMVFFWYALLLSGLDGSKLEWRTWMPLLAYVTCLAITLVLKRIPGVRRIVP